MIVAGEARAKSLQAVAEALGGAQVRIHSFQMFACQRFSLSTKLSAHSMFC